MTLTQGQSTVLVAAQRMAEEKLELDRDPGTSDEIHELRERRGRAYLEVCAEVLSDLYPEALYGAHAFLAVCGAAEIVFREELSLCTGLAEMENRRANGDHLVMALAKWGLLPRMATKTQ